MGNDKTFPAYEILAAFFDEGSFTETDAYLASGSGSTGAVTGFGTVDGAPAYAFAQDAAVCGGAMSRAQAKKITKLYDNALKTGAPIIGFYNSIGGKLEEKFDLLAAYGDILHLSAKLSGVVPQISVILGDCYGASAMIAASADFVIMNQDAKLGLDPAGALSADENAAKGNTQFIAGDAASAVEKAKTLLSYFPRNNLEGGPIYDSLPVYENPDRLPKYIADADSLICAGAGFGDEACTAFGRVAGEPVGFIVTRGEEITSAAARKIARHVRFCDAFSLPVITIVDAKRFESLADASVLVSAYAEATTAKISVISGAAVGAVYIALAGTASGADMVYALPDAVVSPIEAEAYAYLLDESIAGLPYGDQAAAIDAYIKANLTADKAAADGYVDDIAEPEELREKIAAALDMLGSKRVSTLPKKHTTKL